MELSIPGAKSIGYRHTQISKSTLIFLNFGGFYILTGLISQIVENKFEIYI